MHLDFLRTLYESPQDEFGARYVSVYLDVTPTTEDAAAEVELRWRSARGRLAAAGADDATLQAVDQAATRREHEVRGRVVFARDGAVRLAGALPWPPPRQIAALAVLPHVMPWLAQLPARVPHVRVAATKAGAHLIGVPAAGTAPAGDAATVSGAVEASTVEGESWPVHKVSAGGWSEQRLQRSTEEAWAATARRIAHATAAEADRVHAEFVVVGGDVTERSLVLDLLPPPLREAAVPVDREVGADDAAFEQAARAEEDRRTAQREAALLDELSTRLSGAVARERRAVTGLADTLTALREGLASDVLVIGDPSWAAQDVWIGPGLADAATGREALRQGGAGRPLQARADAALIRAAAGTGAELHLLPAGDGRPPAGRPREPVGSPQEEERSRRRSREEAGAAGDGTADAVRDGVAALLRAPAAAMVRSPG